MNHPAAALGSSPLTRGKPALGEVVEGGLGLIPAHAGKTGRQAAHQRHEPAHPRSRGENRLFAFKGVGGVGIRRSGGGSVGGSFGG